MTRSVLSLLACLLLGCASNDPNSDEPSVPGGGGKGDDVDEDGGGLPVAVAPVDLAFLAPLPGPNGSEAPPFSVTTQGPHGPLLSPAAFRTIFDALDGFIDARVFYPPFDDVYTNLFVTGIRYAPCGDQSFHHDGSPAGGCEPKIRLVVQPWFANDDDPDFPSQFDDAALHVFYDVAEDEEAVMQALLEMRDACEEQLGHSTSQHPVGPHPCLEGPQAEAFTERVTAFLHEFAGQRRISMITTMLGLHDGAVNLWQWRVFEVAGERIEAVDPLPHNPGFCVASSPAGDCTEAVELDRFTFHEDGHFAQQTPTAMIPLPDGGSIPASTVARLSAAIVDARFTDDPIGNLGDGGLFADSPENREALVAAYALANPRLVHSEAGSGGVDCINCHIQGSVLTLLEDTGAVDALDAQLQESIARVRFERHAVPAQEHLGAAREFYGRMLFETTEQFVINFGYFGRDASVNPVTVNQAIDASTRFNQLLSDDQEPAPQSGLVLTEYVHASGGRRALELHNGGDAVDLSGCQIDVYFNGATTPGRSVALSDTLAKEETLVLCEGVDGPACVPASLGFNGNDAIALLCDGAVVDGLGRPGSAESWGSRTTLRRRCEATEPSVTPADGERAPDAKFTRFDGLAEFFGESVDALGSFHCDT